MRRRDKKNGWLEAKTKSEKLHEKEIVFGFIWCFVDCFCHVYLRGTAELHYYCQTVC